MKAISQPNAFESFQAFPDKPTAYECIINVRWPDDGVVCTHSSHNEAYGIRQDKLLKHADIDIQLRVGQSAVFPIVDSSKTCIHTATQRNVVLGSTVDTDPHPDSSDIAKRHARDTITHSTEEFVLGDARTNIIESTWSFLKTTYCGIYHKWSKKHRYRYVTEIAGRQYIRDLPAYNGGSGAGITMILLRIDGLVGNLLTYQDQ